MAEHHVRVMHGKEHMNPDATEYWHAFGGFIALGLMRLGTEEVISLLMSRLTRELRRLYGVAGARRCLQGYLDTLAEVATFDEPDETESE